jgi:hypothetical protein
LAVSGRSETWRTNQGEEKQMTGYQIYKRFMKGEYLYEISLDVRAEDAMRNYLRKRDARRAKAKKSK